MAGIAKTIRPESAEQAIRNLAKHQQMPVTDTPLDNWANNVARVSGHDFELDDVEELIVGLRRSSAVDGIELTRLHSRYLDERSAR